MAWMCRSSAVHPGSTPQRPGARHAAPGLLAGWRRCFGHEGHTARHVAETFDAGFNPTTQEGEALLALRAALKPVAADRIGKIDASRLGYWLRSSKDRIVDGWKFAVVASPGGVSEWAVVKA